MATLTSFLRAQVDPFLKAQGFARRGTAYRRVCGEDTMMIWFVPERRFDDASFSFAIIYSLITAPVLAFHRWRQGEVNDWPTRNFEGGPIETQMFRPEGLFQDPSLWVFVYRWPVWDGQEEEAGALVVAALEEQALPRLTRWLDPRLYAEDAANPRKGDFAKWAPELLALMPLGIDSPEVQQALAAGPIVNPFVREWVATLDGAP